MRRLVCVAVAIAGCHRTPTVTCGSGTKLVNGACVVAESTKATPAGATAGSGSAVAPAVAFGTVDTWTYRNGSDAMRNTTSTGAGIQSTNVGNLDMGRSHVTLALRYDSPGSLNPGEHVAFIAERGQFECHDDCSINVKFDDGDIEAWRVAETNRTDSVLLVYPGDFIHRLLRTKKLIIEAEFFQSGAQQFQFNVTGLKWQYQGDGAGSDAAQWHCVTPAPEGMGGWCHHTAEDCEIDRKKWLAMSSLPKSMQVGTCVQQPQAWCFTWSRDDVNHELCWMTKEQCASSANDIGKRPGERVTAMCSEHGATE